MDAQDRYLAALAQNRTEKEQEAILNPKDYRWEITADHLAEAGSRTGTNDNAVGIYAPRGVDPQHFVGVEPQYFQMRDDDGELVYEGILYDPHHVTSGFEPLDDFGTPNAGCTEIRYRNPNGGWETL